MDMKTPWTNRMKSDRVRSDRDFYETPESLAVSAVNKIIPYLGTHSDEDQLNVLDPGCGTGIWGSAVRDLLLNSAHIVGVDIALSENSLLNDYYNVVWEEDYTTSTVSHSMYDLIIGNPPYAVAEQFVRRANNMLVDGGYIYFLLQLNFLGSRKRQVGLFKDIPLKEVHILTRRPSFFSVDGKQGSTDANNYAMYLWQKGYSGPVTMDWMYWHR